MQYIITVIFAQVIYRQFLIEGEKDKKDSEAAKTVIDKINSLPPAKDITKGDESAVQDARKSYDSLTTEQKAKVNSEVLKKLEDSESALKAIPEPDKKANTMSVKGKTVKLKKAKLKRKAQKIKAKRAMTIQNAKGKLTYELVNVKKGKKGFRKKFSINKKTGKITVKKGLKKGTYKVKVKVSAAGDDKYEAVYKNVTVKVIVK